MNPEDLIPNDNDMAAMRAAVAAYIQGDFHGIDIALAAAQERGRPMQFIAAAWAQLGHAYDLTGDNSDEALADWRQGILFHLREDDSQ